MADKHGGKQNGVWALRNRFGGTLPPALQKRPARRPGRPELALEAAAQLRFLLAGGGAALTLVLVILLGGLSFSLLEARGLEAPGTAFRFTGGGGISLAPLAGSASATAEAEAVSADGGRRASKPGETAEAAAASGAPAADAGPSSSGGSPGESRAGAALASGPELSRSTPGERRGASEPAKRKARIARTVVLEAAEIARPDDGPPPPRRPVTPPRSPYRLPPPRYPKEAESQEIRGHVRLRVLIAEDGTVARHEFLEAQPPGYFEKSVEQVLPSWQFKPALDQDQKPIECWKEFRYEFRIEARR